MTCFKSGLIFKDNTDLGHNEIVGYILRE